MTMVTQVCEFVKTHTVKLMHTHIIKVTEYMLCFNKTDLKIKKKRRNQERKKKKKREERKKEPKAAKPV